MKLLKILLAVILVLVLIITSIAVTTRMEGEKQFARYEAVAAEALKAVPLRPFNVKPQYKQVRSMPLMEITVSSRTGERLARVNSLDATMLQFIKMYTLMIRPSYDYNLPVLSVDFIFMPFGKRVYVIEIIDPAKIDDPNKEIHYGRMRAEFLKVADLPTSGTREWYKQFVTDFSIHCKAEKNDDELLLTVFKGYLDAYLAMTNNARQLPIESKLKMKEGLEKYVDTLLLQGGPAVDVFKKILGPDGQQEYVRTIMFGLD